MWKNTPSSYGFINKLLHWISALIIIGLFILGYWMVGLDYYSEWYQKAPHIHQSVGFLLIVMTAFRLVWKRMETPLTDIETHSALVKKSAKAAHNVLYLLIALLMLSGYLIPTSDGRAIEIFNWFEIPALGKLFEKQEDIAGLVHEYLAYSLIAIAFLHALAAIKHHIIDKDDTLNRMIK